MLKQLVPHRDLNLYHEMRHDAMYSLRSEINNQKGLSVFEYAVVLGHPECVHIMLRHRNIFVYPTKFEETPVCGWRQIFCCPKREEKLKFEIEASNLMPEYQCKIKTSDGEKLRHI